jgi:L,D-transpeptidase ErfK/SrfK
MTRLFPIAAIAVWLALPAPVDLIPLSREIVGGVGDHVIEVGETLARLGARAGVDAGVLARTNDLRAGAWLRPGSRIRIDNRHIVAVGRGSIVVNVPQRMLFLTESEQTELAFPVAAGRPTWPTPVGPFSILTKELDPTWEVPISIQHEMIRAGRRPLSKVPPGPDNPLGDRWLGLSLSSVGIHGTNAADSIYRHQTHGCIRLHPDDVRTLFDRVSVGTDGEIVYQPLLLAVIQGHLYLESHRDVYRRAPDPLARLQATAAAAGLTARIDWDAAVAVIRESAGVPREIGSAAAGD